MTVEDSRAGYLQKVSEDIHVDAQSQQSHTENKQLEIQKKRRRRLGWLFVFLSYLAFFSNNPLRARFNASVQSDRCNQRGNQRFQCYILGELDRNHHRATKFPSRGQSQHVRLREQRQGWQETQNR
jgi:hypothetical protein